jgi:haloacid dehalogenase-like hydrolase
MLELLAYLRNSGFKTFIVSGGGIEFMRSWTEQVYGVPSEEVVGSSIETRFTAENGRAELIHVPEINFIDDGDGKPVGINKHIGRRPIAAFGNSDGDLEMLQWATMSSGRRLGLIVHHTDAAREYAYDRMSNYGYLDEALDAAKQSNWILVSMKDDWKRVFQFE